MAESIASSPCIMSITRAITSPINSLLSSLPKTSIATITTMSAPRGGRPPRKHPRRGPRPVTLEAQAQAQLRANGRASTLPPAVQARAFSSTPASMDSTPAPSSPSSGTLFADIPGLSPQLLQAIPYAACTEVQAATLPVILSGKDVLAQAKTGTGKTLGFLVPAIQRLLSGRTPGRISIFIISPTRELAQQITAEAELVLNNLGQGGQFGVKTVVGGTNVNTDIKHLRERQVDVLVATPGRALDLLENADLGVRLSQLKMLVLDEADRLLDQGFRRELEKIIKALPNPKSVPRQTLLFSATIPNEVHTVASLALKPDHEFISTVSEDDVNVHDHVRQELIIADQAEVFSATLLAIQREQAKNPDCKVIVFLPTARAAALFHDVFKLVGAFPVWEIHSRMSQAKRTNTTEQFRAAKRGVLFSSDVIARGIDIKDITAVLQVGLPANSEQYIHRLGRTARAGAEGHGVLILSEWEKFFLNDRVIKTLTLHSTPIGSEAEIKAVAPQITRAMDQVDRKSKEQAYSAWLGYYKTSLKSIKWTPTQLVEHANAYSSDVLRYGPKPPGVLAKTVGKMGLKGVKGLNIVKSLEN